MGSRARLFGRGIASLVAALFVASAAAYAATPAKAPAKAPVRKTAARAHAAPASAAASAGAPGDTILARLPYATISRNDFLRAWAGLDPRYRPAGTNLAAKRAFLDQMIQKDLLAHAAVNADFQMAPLESAQFRAESRDLLRRAVYRHLVADSAVVEPADIDSVNARIAHSGARNIPEAQVRAAAMQFAQHRRAAEVDAEIQARIAAVFDDSVAALLVREYGKLDPRLPDAAKPMALKLPSRQPILSAADSGKVLATSTLGPLTAVDFTRRFMGFDPFKTPLPASITDVRTVGGLILGQRWFDIATEDPRVQNDPDVLAAIQSNRENIALDHYYASHIQARVDTSEATLRARYQRTPDAYALPAQWVVTRCSFASQAGADSAQTALAHGAPWDSICAHAFGEGDSRRNDCASQIPLPDPYPDPIFTQVLQGLKPGESSVLPIPDSKAGDERRLLLRLVGHNGRKFQTFTQARQYVMKDVAQDQSEKILDAEIARLKAATPPTINARALANTDLAGWARMVGGGAPPARQSARPATSVDR